MAVGAHGAIERDLWQFLGGDPFSLTIATWEWTD